MSKRALTVGMLTAGLSAGLVAGAISPAAAQGNQVGGSGNVYFLSGAGNSGGVAQKVMVFGDPGDEVYFGDWDKDGTDSPMVRRGNVFYVADEEGKTVNVFRYGNVGDEVLVGDWDGDGKDTLAVRRGFEFFVKNDNDKSGPADSTFYYGNAGDIVLVGDWDKDGKDTLIVRRGAEYFVKNDTKSGVADYTFVFGEHADTVLVGDWSNPQAKESGDGADQLAVRRGFEYHLSSELGAGPLKTARVFAYGDAGDTVFVASLPTQLVDENGDPLIDEKRTKTYDADVVATHEKGDPILGMNDAGNIVQQKDGFGRGMVYAGGETKAHFKGEPVVYRGVEQKLAADGTPMVYVAHGATPKAHEVALPADGKIALYTVGAPQLAADGSFIYEDDNNDGTVQATDTDGIFEIAVWSAAEITALGAAASYVAEVGDPVLHQAGEQVKHHTTEQKLHDGTLSIVIHENGDLVLNADGTPKKTDTGQYQYWTGGTVHQTDADGKVVKYEAGAPMTERKGDLQQGYQWNGTAWVLVDIVDDEDTSVYLEAGTVGVNTNTSDTVATLDKDSTSEPVWFNGTEPITYDGTEDVDDYKGGESVIAHYAGEVVLDADGNPIVEGTGKPFAPITGDGLGVRRNFS